MSAIAVLVLLGGSPVVQAQMTTPTPATVSDVAVTSSPGTDGAYTTLDVITVSATFSEAVTVTGEPQLSLDVGGTERIAEYAEPGPNTGQLLFRYTVQPTDQDDDGIGVKQDALDAERRRDPGRGRLPPTPASPSTATSFAEPQGRYRTRAHRQHGADRRPRPCASTPAKRYKLSTSTTGLSSINVLRPEGTSFSTCRTPSDTLTLAVTAKTTQ